MNTEPLAVARLLEMGASYNPRRIDEGQLAALRRSLRTFGAVEPVVANRRTGRIVGGHQRVKAAEAEGMETLPVVWVDLDETGERQLNLALNRISGEWDEPALAALLEELGDGALELTGFDGPEVDELVARMRREARQADPDEVPEVPKVAVTKPGDMYVLGKHRLLCGDSTNAADVARVLNGEKPFLCVTDPPYGVNYAPAWREEAAKKGLIRGGAKSMGLVSNDDRHDWSEAWAAFQCDIVYVWHAALFASEVAGNLASVGFLIRSQIIWSKPFAPISRGAYRWQHEPCWYAVRRGKPARWTGDHNQSTVWEIANRTFQGGAQKPEDEGTGHSTQKPVELMTRAIRNHDAPEVYDPFLGSGTTLIAAEQLGRRCYALEIEPRYCDVIVARWEKFTGEKAERITSGGAL